MPHLLYDQQNKSPKQRQSGAAKHTREPVWSRQSVRRTEEEIIGGGGGGGGGGAKAPVLAHRDNSFRLDLINFSAKGPHPMFSPFVVLWLVSSPNLSHCERAVFIMKAFLAVSFALLPSPSLPLPLPASLPLCSALFAAARCRSLIARSQRWHDVMPTQPPLPETPPTLQPSHPSDFIMCWNLFLSTSSTRKLEGFMFACADVSREG